MYNCRAACPECKPQKPCPPEFSTHTHAQPEPKTPLAAVVSVELRAEKLPKAESTAAFSSGDACGSRQDIENECKRKQLAIRLS